MTNKNSKRGKARSRCDGLPGTIHTLTKLLYHNPDLQGQKYQDTRPRITLDIAAIKCKIRDTWQYQLNM